MLNRAIVAISFAALLCLSSYAQVPKEVNGGLSVEATVVSSTYKEGDVDLCGVEYALRLKFTNHNPYKVLVSKSAGMIQQALVASVSDDGPQLSIAYSWLVARKPINNFKVSNFYQLSNRGSFSTETSITLFYSRDQKTRINGSLLPGRYYAWFDVGISDLSVEEERKAETDLKRYGNLYTRTITSERIVLTIEPPENGCTR